MATEYFIDRISNVSVQGPIVSVDLGRLVSEAQDKNSFKLDKRLTITLTGQNFISLVKTLNESLKAIADRKQSDGSNDTDTNRSQSEQKDSH